MYLIAFSALTGSASPIGDTAAQAAWTPSASAETNSPSLSLGIPGQQLPGIPQPNHHSISGSKRKGGPEEINLELTLATGSTSKSSGSKKLAISEGQKSISLYPKMKGPEDETDIHIEFGNTNIPAPETAELRTAVNKQFLYDRSHLLHDANNAVYIMVPSGWVCRKVNDAVITTMEYVVFDYIAGMNIIGSSETFRERKTWELKYTFSRNFPWTDSEKTHIKSEANHVFSTQDLSEHNVWRYSHGAYVVGLKQGNQQVAIVNYQYTLSPSVKAVVQSTYTMNVPVMA